MKVQPFRVGIIDTNCYLVTDEEKNESFVVDPGDMSPRLEAALKEGNVKYILLTHGHYDHILGAAEAKSLTGAEILIHSADAPCLYDSDLSRAGLHFPLEQEKITADRTLEDGDEIDFAGKKIKVIHTPGHTPGCVCYLCEEDELMFSGDTLFQMSMGRTDFPGGSTLEMINSLSRLRDLSENYTVFPGHGPATSLDFERENNPYMREL